MASDYFYYLVNLIILNFFIRTVLLNILWI